MTPPSLPPEAPVWAVPPEPVWPRRLGRAGLLLVMLLALVWWGSLFRDARLGMVSAWWPVASLCLLGIWGRWVWRSWAPRRAVGPSASWPSHLYWCDGLEDSRDDRAAAPFSLWRAPDGGQVRLSIAMDLGGILLLKLMHGDNGGARHRWVRAADLTGPWRWRLVMASRGAGLSGAAHQIVASSRSSTSSKPSLFHHLIKALRALQERA